MAIEAKSDAKLASPDQPEYQARPRYGAWVEGDKLVLEIALPGVHKENIQIKTLKDYFTLRANRGKMQYALDLDLNVDVEPEKTTAHYEEGLLRVELTKFNPIEKAVEVPVNGKTREKKDQKDAKPSYRIFPDISREADYTNQTVDIEILIPGVKEEDIMLKVLPTWFNMTAKRARDDSVYQINTGFGAEIVPAQTTATYENGLLKIHAKIHDRLDDAKEVKL